MSADILSCQRSDAPEEVGFEASQAAGLEFRSVCDRFDLSVSQRLSLLADMTARAASEASGRAPGWQDAARLILRDTHRRACILLQRVIDIPR